MRAQLQQPGRRTAVPAPTAGAWPCPLRIQGHRRHSSSGSGNSSSSGSAGVASTALAPTACAVLPRPGRQPPAIVPRATTAAEVAGRELTAEEESAWQASCEALSAALGRPADECNRLLARAFGWTSQAYWRREKVEELPSVPQVAGALAFLQAELGMSGEEAGKAVAAFPELLACDVEGRLRANAAQLRNQWRLQGPTLCKAVLRQPQVLGYSLDCGGDCVGECNRCWARF